MPQLVTLVIDSLVYEMIYTVDKTSDMFHHFTRYSRSMNAIISYINNEIILHIYTFINDLYLETKKFFLSKAIQYTYKMEFLLKNSPWLLDSKTIFSSNDIHTIIYLVNNRLRRLLLLWINSSIEYKIMKTGVNQLTELIDKFRFHLDDKLDVLLPKLKIYTPQLWTNSIRNQTFLLSWSEQHNLTKILDQE